MAMRRARDAHSHSLSSNDSEGKGENRRKRYQRLGDGKMVELDIPGKLFIRGLAGDADEKVIENEFAKFGRITEIIVIRDKVTLQSRGYGFVTYENPIDAEDAVKAMEGVDLNGKTIHVEQAVRAQHSYDDGYRRGRGGRGRGGMSPRGRRGGGGRMGGGRGPPDMPPRRGGMGGRGMRPGGRGGPRGPPRREGRDMRDSRDMRDFSPPPRREDRFSSSYSERTLPPRGRDYYSPPRDSSRGLLDSRMGPSRSMRDYPVRDYSPDRAPMRDRSMTSREYAPVRSDDRRDSFTRSNSRDYSTRGGGGDYFTTRDTTRDYAVRDYPPSRDYSSREPNGRDRDYGVAAPRFSTRSDLDREYDTDLSSRAYSGPGSRGPPSVSTRGPPSFTSRGPPRDDRDSFGPAARRPGPPMSRGPPPAKRSRMDGPPPFRR